MKTNERRIAPITAMKMAYNITEARRRLPELVRRAESGRLVRIVRRDRPVAFIMGVHDLAALIETAEIMSNPKARAAIADAEAGRGRTYSLAEIVE